MNNLSDENIITSWKKNVTPWIEAIRNKEIQSRELVTNQAIVDAIIQRSPRSMIDIGCGEGWLVRELSKAGIDCLGVDVVPELIDYASQAGEGRFKTLSYTELNHDGLKETFDLAVCNFSLLGKESVEKIFTTIPTILNAKGFFIVQTIHPIMAGGDEPYIDGWREGSWSGFSDQFRDPAPWYFRTIEGWQALFLKNGFKLTKMLEPINPQTNAATSVIFVGQLPH